MVSLLLHTTMNVSGDSIFQSVVAIFINILCQRQQKQSDNEKYFCFRTELLALVFLLESANMLVV